MSVNTKVMYKPTMKLLPSALSFTLLFSGYAYGQGETSSFSSPSTGVSNVLTLTPEIFARRVAENNASIQVARYEIRVTKNKLDAESYQYQPLAYASARHEGRKRLNTVEEQIVSSSIPFLSEKVFTRAAGIKGQMPSGGNYKFGYSAEQRTNNIIQTQTLGLEHTEYTASLGITIQQPLSRGLGREVTEINKNIADIENKIAIEEYKIQLYKSLVDGFGDYWQAYKLLQIVELNKENLQDAKTLAKNTGERVQAGMLPSSSSLEINSLVLNRNIEYQKAKQSVLEIESKLLTLMGMTGIATHAITLTPDSATFTEMANQSVSRQSDFENNIDKWPAYRIEVLRRNESQIKQRYARNQMEPSFNLEASVNGTGFSYYQDTALSLSHTSHYPDWYVGIGYEQPLFGNKQAKSQYLAQSEKIMEGVAAMAGVRLSYMNDLEVTSAKLDAAISAERDTAQEVALRQQLYDNVKKAFLLGNTPLSTVVQKNTDLLDSRGRLLGARSDVGYSYFIYKYYRNAVLDTYRITVNE